MADYEKAFEILMKLEFSNPSNFLHKNKTERDYTVAGIYKYAHPKWLGWFIVMDSLQRNNGNVVSASRDLYKNYHLKELIMNFYKSQFWDRMRLDEVKNDNTATEIFVFAVNAGTRNAIRKVQKLVGADADGLMGPVTLGFINSFDPDKFDIMFDEVELKYYDDIIKNKPSFAIYKNGWKNRAEYV